MFNPILELWPDDPTKGQQTVFMIGSGFALVGAIIALFFVKDIKPGDDLQIVDREYEEYVRENGL